MRRAVVAVLALVMVLGCAAPAGAARGPDAVGADRIAGGYYPADYEWPWVTALTDSARGGDSDFENNSCTATLIAPQRVLTAAHCVLERDGETPRHPSRFQALVGRRSLHGSEGERRNVTAIAVHPKAYLPVEGEHTNHAFYDIAVMFLDSPVSITPATLGTSQDWAQYGTVMGWGHVNYDHDNPQKGPDLKAADLYLGSDAECGQAINSDGAQHYYPSIHICANDPEDQDCVTHGDSGGPLMVKTGGTWKLIGVTSFYPLARQCGPIGFAWVAGAEMRSWPLTVQPPTPRGGGGGGGGGDDGGGGGDTGGGLDLSMAGGEVRRYIRAMIASHTNGKVRRLKRRCRRIDYNAFRCRLSWRIKRRSYKGRVGFMHIIDDEGEAAWTYAFRGTLKKRGCRARCTRRLRW